MINRELLQKYTAELGLSLTAAACDKFDRYAALLVEWNEKMNLTAITDPDEMVLKHFTDSLTALPLLPKSEGITLVDVGTGAGFPAIPLAIARPDLQLTLLDSLNKRLTFLDAVCEELGITARTVHARAEEAGQNAAFRERFDVATARAVAATPTLLEYCLPLVKTGGRFVALKGPESDNEHEAIRRAAAKLGGGEPMYRALQLPVTPKEGIEPLQRRLVVVEKTKPTPKTYPRPTAKIKKDPLG